ncbi:MAG: C2H2-type zinc finger protein [Deltaproteobacteria bacterium]|nr:C2H2-type zinc finger protein [Deltaproteobacteria bacterium]
MAGDDTLGTVKNVMEITLLAAVVGGLGYAGYRIYQWLKGEGEGYAYVCPYCGDRFPTYEALKEHIRTEHPETLHICPICGEIFYTAAQLAAHMEAAHAEPDVVVGLKWQVDEQWVAGDQTFLVGSIQRMEIYIENPTAREFNYRVSLYFGDILNYETETKGAVIRRRTYMPREAGTYPVTMLVHETVTDTILGPFSLGTLTIISVEARVGLTWDQSPPFAASSVHTVTIRVANPMPEEHTYWVDFFFGYTLVNGNPYPVVPYEYRRWTDVVIPPATEVEMQHRMTMPDGIASPLGDYPVGVVVGSVETGVWELFPFGSVTVIEAAPAMFSGGVDWGGQTFPPGTTVHYRAWVRNDGQDALNIEAQLCVDHAIVSWPEIGWLSPGETYQWEGDYTMPPYPGSYYVRIYVITWYTHNLLQEIPLPDLTIVGAVARV